MRFCKIVGAANLQNRYYDVVAHVMVAILQNRWCSEFAKSQVAMLLLRFCKIVCVYQRFCKIAD
jgi:hypothetical protein